MQAELARLDPKALESLPKELKDQLPKGLPAVPAAAGRCRGCPGCRGCLAERCRDFPAGLPGLPGKKK